MAVHPTALVDPQAVLGSNVHVGPYTIIHGAVRLGSGTSIGSHCELGVPVAGSEEHLSIGADSQIRSHSVFYAGSSFGDGLKTGHRVTVREGTITGPDCQLGTLADVQGDCNIGHSFRSQSNVTVGKHSRIGDYVWMFPMSILTNDPHPPSNVQLGVTLEDFVVVATAATVLPGVRVGAGALVGAHTLVWRDVPPSTVVSGVPGRFAGHTSDIQLQQEDGGTAYPWRRHFHRGYPADAIAAWRKEFEEE